MSVALKQIQQVWYQKLKEEGFEDIEKSKDNIHRWHCSFFQNKYTPESFTIKQTYYRLASQFLENFMFERELDLEIWRLHSEGVPLREIAKQKQMKTCQIFKMVKSLKKHMLEIHDY